MKFSKLILALILYSNLAQAAPYLESKIISPTLLDGSYATDSKEWVDEIKKIINLQKNADTKEIAKAKQESDLTPDLIAESIDKNLTRKNYPKVYILLDHAFATAMANGEEAKKFFNNKRPYLIDKNIKALIEPNDNPSYPSIHTCTSYVTANILNLLLPKKREKIYARSREIAGHRILVGMHYPRDIEGGKQLAMLVTGSLLQLSDFQKEFWEAKSEVDGLGRFRP